MSSERQGSFFQRATWAWSFPSGWPHLTENLIEVSRHGTVFADPRKPARPLFREVELVCNVRPSLAGLISCGE
jgi:hypothetical protein